jgi:hypothetical protein
VIAGRRAIFAVAAIAAILGLHFHGAAPKHAVAHAQAIVQDTLDGPRYGDAKLTLERWRDLSGSYAGADVTGGHLTLRWATDFAYCVEGVSAARGLEHLVGPTGKRERGACPW